MPRDQQQIISMKMHYFSLVEEFLEVADDELPGDGEEDVSRHGELPRQLPRNLLRLLNRLPPPEVLKQRPRETLLLIFEVVHYCKSLLLCVVHPFLLITDSVTELKGLKTKTLQVQVRRNEKKEFIVL